MISTFFLFIMFCFFISIIGTSFEELSNNAIFDCWRGILLVNFPLIIFEISFIEKISDIAKQIDLLSLQGLEDPLEKCCYSDYRIISKKFSENLTKKEMFLLSFLIYAYRDFYVSNFPYRGSLKEIPVEFEELFGSYNFQYIAECFIKYYHWI